PGLYIGASSGFSGKNLLAMGIGLRFQKEGYKVGYMKPVGTLPSEQENKMGDEDAFFVQDILGLTEDLDLVTPVLVTHDLHMQIFSEGCPDLMTKIVNAYQELEKDKDIVLVCGSGSYLHTGKYCNIAGLDVSKALGSKVILIDRFFKEFNYDYILGAQEHLEDDLLGVVFNCVPESHISLVDELLKPLMERRQVNILGTIPEDPILNAIKISELANRLGGKIITVPNKAEKIVENFLIGTMQVENFMTHFKKRKNSAIIVGGDRSDLQLVAIEGQCPCLILTGNLYPNDIILTRSEVLEVPIIVVREDTYTIAKKMESILESIKLRDYVKIEHGAKIVDSIMDWETIKKGLNLYG
ncbi:MAG TPA: DRTGG domain-containing protein, partial [Desulfohalobiaceae bacterium]|nr:DRTGG domain-containing protein [Desulfohalobiaceae bacterium]